MAAEADGQLWDPVAEDPGPGCASGDVANRRATTVTTTRHFDAAHRTETNTAHGVKLTPLGRSHDNPATASTRRTLAPQALPPALLPLMVVAAFLLAVFAGVGLAVTDQSSRPLGILPIVLPLVCGSWLLWGVLRRRRSPQTHPQRHRHGHSIRRRRVAVTSLAVPMLITSSSLLAQGAFLVRYQANKHEADTAVCKALQRLDGTTAQPSVIAAIHDAGRNDDDQLGHVVRAADGNEWPGHLSLVSEDYDRVTNTCDGLSLPVPNLG